MEYAGAPMGIDDPHPRFSWIVAASGRNQVQSAFRIRVSCSKENLNEGTPDMWDSGKILTSETIQHEYMGKPLRSNGKYFWIVTIWDGNGIESESPVSWFGTAILNPSEWNADWIGNGPADQNIPAKVFFGNVKEQADLKDTIVHNGRSLLLRKDAFIGKKVSAATAFVTGLGYYEFYINGHRVGDRVLSPAKTPYHRYILYDTYDVAGLLRTGKNAFGFHLGNGWYNPYKKWWAQYRMQWFGHKKAIAQIHLRFEDGSEQVITTDGSWKWADGPVLYNCVYDGEEYDANAELPGWNKPGFNDAGWKFVTVFKKSFTRLELQQMPPIKVTGTIEPEELKVSVPGRRVFDMGQNFAGWISIKVKGEKDTRLKIRFAEDIHDDGTIDATSNENARATSVYILKGSGIEEYEPAFSFFGFRYVEISSENKPFKLIDLRGKVVHSANTPTGTFVCGNELVNKIHKATVWSQRSNMMGYPMDCPQRDERLGWMGDAQVTAEEALYNFDMALFYENWFHGIMENQDNRTGDLPVISPQPYMTDEGVEWSSSYFIMLWQFYTFYGDLRILSEHYLSMKRYLDFLGRKATEHIIPSGWIGDWGSLVKEWKEGQPESVPTAFYYMDAVILSKTADLLGYKNESLDFRTLADSIRSSYNKKFLNPMTGNYGIGSQMDNTFPLYLGLVPESLRGKVLDNLMKDIKETNSYHLTTGVLGTKYLPEALAQSGMADIAWKIINQKTYPGWSEMMKRYTTMCEFWTLKQSKNHVMMGSIDAWFYKYLAGIQPDETGPGWSSFTIRPYLPDSLDQAGATVETIKGTISSYWKREKDRFTLAVEVPFNTSAKVCIPCAENSIITEGDQPVGTAGGIDDKGYSDGYHVFIVHSGKYTFIASEKPIK